MNADGLNADDEAVTDFKHHVHHVLDEHVFELVINQQGK